jgi:ABC-type antimicrobial peptide transport system permease subunit
MGLDRDAEADTEIIGVLANARYDRVRGRVPRQTFVSLGGRHLRTAGAINVYARTDGDPRALVARLRQEVRRVDANLVVSDVRTLRDQVDQQLSGERMLSFLSTSFAVLATLLAAVGLYGVLDFVVTRRTREIGIRVALGAVRARVVGLVLREVLLVFVVGTSAGVAAGFAGFRFVESELFGVEGNDPLVLAGSVAALLGVVLAAALLPARRAARLDPVRALRHE